MKRAAGLALLLAAAAPDPVIAVRGADQITASEVRALVAAADPQTRIKLTTDSKALQDLIRDALLQRGVLASARAAGWDRRPEIVALLARTRDAAIAQSYVARHTGSPAGYPSDAELQAAYDQAKPQLMQPRAYHIAQLFITLPVGAKAVEVDKARRTLGGLFDTYTASASPALPTGVQASDLGWVAENRLQQAARDVIGGLPEGQVAGPICTPPGCALLKLVATRPAGPPPLAEIRDSLIRLLRQRKEGQSEQAYANTLLAHEPVRIDEIQLAKVPLH